MVPGQAKQCTHQAGGDVGFVWVCIENTATSVERDVGRRERWVLLKIPRCDIDGVGEVK